MATTLNKDGTPRKVGSGKTKGAGCFTHIKWEQLKEFIGENDDIQVSRVWLRSVGALSQKRGSRKKVLPHKKIISSEKKLSAIPTNKIIERPLHSASSSQDENDEDDYNPPPLFGLGGEIRNY